jgi:hypothetical protein
VKNLPRINNGLGVAIADPEGGDGRPRRATPPWAARDLCTVF